MMRVCMTAKDCFLSKISQRDQDVISPLQARPLIQGGRAEPLEISESRIRVQDR